VIHRSRSKRVTNVHNELTSTHRSRNSCHLLVKLPSAKRGLQFANITLFWWRRCPFMWPSLFKPRIQAP